MNEPLNGLEQMHLRRALAYAMWLEQEASISHGVSPDHSLTPAEIMEAARGGVVVNDFGSFVGNVVAAWLDDGRAMRLREDFAFVDTYGKTWTAPKDSIVDGASIPRAFWRIIGGPFEGQYRNASVIHDVACDQMAENWDDVHRMFYAAMRAGGVGRIKAKTMFYAVWNFGPRWMPGGIMLIYDELQKLADEDTVTKAEAFFAANDPELGEIENLKLE